MQTTNNLLMIRPVRFSFNEQTADSNSFQNSEQKNQDVQQKAQDEFDHMVDLLDENGITVFVVEDTPEPHTPDSIFPNNSYLLFYYYLCSASDLNYLFQYCSFIHVNYCITFLLQVTIVGDTD